jgi:hypothetical protein
MTTKTLSKSELAQFTGSDNCYRHTINRNVLYTDGAQHVAAEEFQVWKLTVHPHGSATLTCDDGNDNIVLTKKIEYTDFPLDEITLYFANNVIHLPSEY